MKRKSRVKTLIIFGPCWSDWDAEGESRRAVRLKHLFMFNLRWNWFVLLKTGEGAIKRQLLSPSITARRAPADWRPGRRRSRLRRGSWGLITDPGGQGRVWVFKLTASVFMAFSENRSPGHYSHSCLQSSQQSPDLTAPNQTKPLHPFICAAGNDQQVQYFSTGVA